jgi:diphthine-ammonia ligase
MLTQRRLMHGTAAILPLRAHANATERRFPSIRSQRPLRTALAKHGLDWRAVFVVNLALADMRHFAAVNTAYCHVVPQSAAPARACVQLPLPSGCAATVSVLAVTGGSVAARRTLHVQSISEWAPACIGPYSQATLCHGLLHIAGQIPLDPATMQVCSGSCLLFWEHAAARPDLLNQFVVAICCCGNIRLGS